MVPGDFKRKYRFRSNTSNEKKYFNIAIIVTLIVLIVLWYLIN